MARNTASKISDADFEKLRQQFHGMSQEDLLKSGDSLLNIAQNAGIENYEDLWFDLANTWGDPIGDKIAGAFAGGYITVDPETARVAAGRTPAGDVRPEGIKGYWKDPSGAWMGISGDSKDYVQDNNGIWSRLPPPPKGPPEPLADEKPKETKPPSLTKPVTPPPVTPEEPPPAITPPPAVTSPDVRQSLLDNLLKGGGTALGLGKGAPEQTVTAPPTIGSTGNSDIASVYDPEQFRKLITDIGDQIRQKGFEDVSQRAKQRGGLRETAGLTGIEDQKVAETARVQSEAQLGTMVLDLLKTRLEAETVTGEVAGKSTVQATEQQSAAAARSYSLNTDRLVAEGNLSLGAASTIKDAAGYDLFTNEGIAGYKQYLVDYADKYNLTADEQKNVTMWQLASTSGGYDLTQEADRVSYRNWLDTTKDKFNLTAEEQREIAKAQINLQAQGYDIFSSDGLTNYKEYLKDNQETYNLSAADLRDQFSWTMSQKANELNLTLDLDREKYFNTLEEGSRQFDVDQATQIGLAKAAIQKDTGIAAMGIKAGLITSFIDALSNPYFSEYLVLPEDADMIVNMILDAPMQVDADLGIEFPDFAFTSQRGATPIDRAKLLLGSAKGNRTKLDEHVNSLSKSFGAAEGDLRYNPLYDFDKDGLINMEDMWILQPFYQLVR